MSSKYQSDFKKPVHDIVNNCRYLDIYCAYSTIIFLGSTRLLGFQVAAPDPGRLPI